MAAKTFEDLHRIAREQDESKEAPDTRDAVDAMRVARVLMDWLAANTTDAQRTDIAAALAKAVGL